VRTGSGDVYAGRDGNVYRKQDGGWQKYDNGNWGAADRPEGTGQARDRASSTSGTPRTSSTTMDNLNRDSNARTEGRQRTNDYGNYRSNSGSRSSGSSYRSSGGGSSYRGGGGGMRGGGGRRR